MLHTIENEHLKCTIESNGAEIRSLIDKNKGKEYIWQIDESVWGSSSPVLFPAIGNIKDGKQLFEGKEFAMTKHGIIRNNDQLIFKQLSRSSCAFTLNSSEKTLEKYPFDFSFTVEYSIIGNKLKMDYHIENNGTVPMYFACGGHTAYACPIDENVKLSDYVIEFPIKNNLKSRKLGPTGLLSNEEKEISIENRSLQLSDTLFNEDALIFSNIDFDWVRLRKVNEAKGVIVRFTGYPNLAIWSKPSADYVCIEPWLGLPDSEEEALALPKKSTYKSLDPNSKFSISITTEIEK
ncbi:aldose 1-epimerase family protein [Brumimicrobium aurantiacum]|uniref:Aldose 1-epimerase family protein n=1 Tax=Brumimicrobium aurantiacum TaxID=1737063 RepID=A0A3E1EZT5_9FLAO|nr:aldose 1-epimerase family protein [Brumimicrobium aurantiacum]RFC55071.1 aldose 1-epimerase family protein [Brumimicrobium aurantiacum]